MPRRRCRRSTRCIERRRAGWPFNVTEQTEMAEQTEPPVAGDVRVDRALYGLVDLSGLAGAPSFQHHRHKA